LGTVVWAVGLGACAECSLHAASSVTKTKNEARGWMGMRMSRVAQA
jgi:hypothetical protein